MDSDLAAPSFGTLLKQFRQRRQLTQLALAYKIGKKSRGSIQAWEDCRYGQSGLYFLRLIL